MGRADSELVCRTQGNVEVLYTQLLPSSATLTYIITNKIPELFSRVYIRYNKCNMLKIKVYEWPIFVVEKTL